MSIEEQLKSEILLKFKSIRAFTTANKIPYSTLDSIFKRGILNAGVGTILKVFGALDLDIESVNGEKLYHLEESKENPPSTDCPTPGETHLISLYRELNNEGCELLVDYADTLVTSQKYIKSSTSGLGKAQM